MATITIVPPDGWTSPKAVQQVMITHLARHGATMTITLHEEGKSRGKVKSATITLPDAPSVEPESDTDEAQVQAVLRAHEAKIAKIRGLITDHYGRTETE